jgi:hypothetical protein
MGGSPRSGTRPFFKHREVVQHLPLFRSSGVKDTLKSVPNDETHLRFQASASGIPPVCSTVRETDTIRHIALAKANDDAVEVAGPE